MDDRDSQDMSASMLRSRYNRRALLRRAALLGASAPAVAALLAACGGSDSTPAPGDGGGAASSPASGGGGSGDGGDGGSGGGEPAAGGTLTIALPGDITSLDPTFAYDFTTNPVVTNITEGLLQILPDGSITGCLAESWEASDDALTYTYKLRQGVTFSDGTPMTADDVVFSLERARDSSSGNYISWMLDSVDTIEKTDDSTVTVTLSHPDAMWQYVPATTAGHVLSKQYVESNPNFGKPDGGTLGTGPFTYVSWQVGSEVVLEKNANYWDSAAGPYVDQLVFKVLTEGTTRVAGLKTGEIDMIISGVPVDQLRVVDTMDNVEVLKVPGAMVNFVAFNNSKPPFNDVHLRKALAYAVDIEAIRAQFAGDSSMPAKPTLLAPGLFTFEKDAFQQAFDALPDYAQDMDKAREELAQSAYADGVQATIVTDNDPVRLNVAQALASAVKDLGIDLQVEKVTWEELVSRLLGTKDYDAAMDVFSSDFPDPAGNLHPTLISTNAGEGGANQVMYSNPEVDQLLEQQNALTDPKERAELLIQAQALVAEDLPFIAVDYPYQIAALQTNIQGFEFGAFWYWMAWAKSLKRA